MPAWDVSFISNTAHVDMECLHCICRKTFLKWIMKFTFREYLHVSSTKICLYIHYTFPLHDCLTLRGLVSAHSNTKGQKLYESHPLIPFMASSYKKNVQNSYNSDRKLLLTKVLSFLVCVLSPFSCVQLFDPMRGVYQAPLSMGFPRQEYWSSCHALLQGIFLT